MIGVLVIDMSKRKSKAARCLTATQKWRNEQIDRLCAWEMLCRYIKHEHTTEMSHSDMCDRIGTPKDLLRKILKSARTKINGK
jgi:hypothetical protein